jgi:uncharacterized membrane protein YgaE (UPF0421/DUF939 family)
VRPLNGAGSTSSKKRTPALVDALRLPTRAGLAAGLAVLVATTLSLGSPLYALVSAVIVSDLDPAQSRKLAVPRMIGTTVGAAIGCVVALLVQTSALAIAIGVLLPMLVCQLFRQPAAAKVSGYVSGIIILGFSTDPWTHARDRLLETLLGIAVAAAISAIPPLFRKQDSAG